MQAVADASLYEHATITVVTDTGPVLRERSKQPRWRREVPRATQGILELVDAALAGGGMDHRREALVRNEIDETERSLATLRLRIAEA